MLVAASSPLITLTAGAPGRAPAEITPPTIPLIKEQFIDLGLIPETGDKFIPRLYWHPRGDPAHFQGNVSKNEAVHSVIRNVNYLCASTFSSFLSF